jgi:WD40 repeat protein
MKTQRNESAEQITCIRWLSNGTSFAIGTSNGNITIWNISKDSDANKIKKLTPQPLPYASENKAKY